MRLGWPTRLGIVLTAFWLPISALYFASDQKQINLAVAEQLRDVCAKIDISVARNPNHCLAEYKATVEDLHSNNWYGLIEALKISGLIALLGWLLGVAIYWSARWVMAGRK